MKRWKLTEGRLAHATGYVYYPSVETNQTIVESTNNSTDGDEVRSVSGRLECLYVDALSDVRAEIMMDTIPAHFGIRMLHHHVRMQTHSDGSTARRASHITLGTSNVRSLHPTVTPVRR